MRAEKIILSFIAVFVGLIAAGVAFYFYQSTKVTPPSDKQNTVAVKSAMTHTPEQTETNIFTIDSPTDQAVINKKIVTVSGKTVKGAIITISTDDLDQVVQPADSGDFTLTQTIPDGTSVIEFTALFPDGTQKIIKKTVTFSTENF